MALLPLFIPPPLKLRWGGPLQQKRKGVTDLGIHLFPYLTFLIIGTANKQVTTAGVSKARWGVFKGHMPLRL